MSSGIPAELDEAALASSFNASASSSATTTNETGKISAILGFLKNAIGVKDLGSLRVSLPASVCDPLSFLEHMVLMDRPELFLAIPETETAEERMLAVVRFLLSTNGVHMRKLYKSYNPVLGERYTCIFEPEKPLPLAMPPQPTPPSSRVSASSKRSVSTLQSDQETVVAASERASMRSMPTTFTANGRSDSASASSSNGDASSVPLDDGKIVYVTEQVSHHPPKMAFAYLCPSRNLSFTGVCHISGRFTGTSVKLRHQYGMEVQSNGETYRATFPRGSIKGFVTLSPYVQLEDVSTIICKETGLRAVIHYKDEKWYSVSRSFLISGFISRMEPTTEELPPLKNPEKDLYPGEKLLWTLSGDWQGKVTATNVKTGKSFLLIDMEGADKIKRHRIEKPDEKQGPLESQKVWAEVNAAILGKDFSQASRSKTAVEEKQRTLLAARKRNGLMTFSPNLFDLVAVPRYGPESIAGLEDFPTDDCPVDNKNSWISAIPKKDAVESVWDGPVSDLKETQTLGREIDHDIEKLRKGIGELLVDAEKDREVFH